jgi:CHAT domain-containing protein/tetratricopeptide (TPR) repeat protein
MMIAGLLLVVAFAGAGAGQRHTPTPLDREVMRAFQLLGQSRFDEARAELTRIAEEARAAGDHTAAAESTRGLARIAAHELRLADAKVLLARALEEAEASRVDFFIGEALNDWGLVAYKEGNGEEVRTYYLAAAERYRTSGAVTAYANALRNATFASGMTMEEKVPLLERVVEVAQQNTIPELEAAALHQWGDTLFSYGDYAQAVDKTRRAVELFEAAGNRADLARALTSLGRAERAHGHPEEALAHYRRALDIQVAIGDLAGQSQSENTIAVAIVLMGNPTAALEHYQRALALAEASGAPARIRFQRAQLASGYLSVGRFDEAANLLRTEIADHPDPGLLIHYQSHLAKALAGLGQWDAALAASDAAVAGARAPGAADAFPEVIMTRATIRRDAGRADLALADGREALDAFERLRAKAVPDDFHKSGFGDRLRDAYSLTIGLLAANGQQADAMLAAESARGRAFVDLLASKDVTIKHGTRLNAAAVQPAAAVATSSTPSAVDALTFRGGGGAGGTPSALDPNLPSLVTVPAISRNDMTAMAARLHSTLLAFWVEADAVYTWVVSPDGTVEGHRTVVDIKELERLVRETWQSLDPSSKTRGIVTRGGAQLSVGSGRGSYRTLYDLLIAPIAPRLPAATGARVTIVPHGPLFGLSFAALLDPRGRYFIERYTLHYAPSAATLQMPERAAAEKTPRPPRYLLVADPAPAGQAGDKLPRLPGARDEAAAVRALLPARSATVITGTHADLSRVAALAPGSTVLHFATHGVVLDDRPLDSYLALAGGRLTTRDIYGLDLHADLVVLSACRSGTGRITGDGIEGLTRAFFYAGTPSILATLSDVADVSAGYFVPRFYRSWQRSGDKAAALRSAQLSLLRALRAGQIKVHTAAGDFVVPEHPALWAPFVLIGQPQ